MKRWVWLVLAAIGAAIVLTYVLSRVAAPPASAAAAAAAPVEGAAGPFGERTAG